VARRATKEKKELKKMNAKENTPKRKIGMALITILMIGILGSLLVVPAAAYNPCGSGKFLGCQNWKYGSSATCIPICQGSTPTKTTLTITKISPTSGIKGSTVEIWLQGSGYTYGSKVSLAKSGKTQGCTFIGVSTDGKVMAASCKIGSGMSTGVWDVVAKNPDGQGATLRNAFTVIKSR
jgi:hypothetical protein